MNPNSASEKDQIIVAIKEEEILVTPESNVSVHIGIVNQGASDDYFDILVKGVPAEWLTVDTPAIHVAAGEAKQVIVTIQPPAILQNRVGQYPLDVQAISQSDPTHTATAHSFVTVAAYQSGGRIGVVLGSIYFSVAPGSAITVPVLLQNHGLQEDVFQLSIEGIPANWISTNAIFTKLEPSASQEIEFNISVPHSAEAGVGRTPFKILLISQNFPDQKAEVECILTVAAFSKFSASLHPRVLQDDQAGHLTIYNEGNVTDTYSISFRNPANALLFEKKVQISKTGTQSGAQKIQMVYVEIPKDERIQIDPGMQLTYPFRSRLRSRPLVGNEKTYPFILSVSSAENMVMDLPAETNEKGFIPPWAAAALTIGPLVLCLLFLASMLVPPDNRQAALRATQTMAFQQTQTAAMQATSSGQLDSDGDGLSNTDEQTLGTDSLIPDTDEDGLLDGQEVTLNKTNPLVADTDTDGLPDGDEVLKYKTNVLIPDTDADALKDGDEISRRTDPLSPDTDKDGLGDGVELSFGTDPLQVDSDKDGLLDGQENQVCPRVLVPDSDGDGVLDAKDIEPCNPNNPLWTATAVAAVQTQQTQPPPATAIPPTAIPTNIPTNIPAPTNTPVIVPTNTVAAPPQPTVTVAPFPTLQGIMLFESNRDGNQEIYALNLASQSLLRVTNNPTIDMQPALASDMLRVVYVSNRTGNNEIYLTGLNREPPVNLTNHPGDDQQPTWSPDGNWIAFTSNRDGNEEIYVMRSDGSNVHNLTANVGSDFAPVWFSIPGFLSLTTEEWIAFTSNRDGNQEIYRVRPDGAGLTNLTKNPANDYSPAGFANGGLIFVTDRDGNPEIYAITSGTISPANITNNFSQDVNPSLDPNGKWVAFSSDRGGNMDVYVIELKGSNIYNVTNNPAQDTVPDW